MSDRAQVFATVSRPAVGFARNETETNDPNHEVIPAPTALHFFAVIGYSSARLESSKC